MRKEGWSGGRVAGAVLGGVLLLLLAAGARAGRPAEDDVREPAVAGSFYPDDPRQLEAAVRGFLEDAVPRRGERPIALVAPHAGYLFSGPVDGDAWRQAQGFPVDLVVILGTNHTDAGFDGISVFQGAGYRTPLGVAPVDREAARALLAEDPEATFRPTVDRREHSVEVQVPFAQVLFPKARLLTAIVGRPDPAMAARFGRALARVLRGRQALVVASSDLSHYPSHGDAAEVDRRTLEAIVSLNPEALAARTAQQMGLGRPGLVTCACGEGAVMAAMAAASALGATRGVVLSYANSGDTVAGEEDRVVGYGAVMLTAGPGGPDTRVLEPPPTGPPTALTAEDKAALLRLARTTLERFFASGTVPLPRAGTPGLKARRGAFVTLTEKGELRGCIGHMAEDWPLALTVARMALQAALHDPRFLPVRASEVPDLRIEISALTPFTRVAGPGAIQVGRDGVLIEKGGRSAVFLPQVAPEQGWSRDEMLDHLCEKAGLPGNCWHGGTTFRTFQADVFSEPKR